MRNRIHDMTVLLAMLAAMGGCSHAPLSKTFNEANANNIAVQTINPEAGKDDAAPNTLDGQKAEQLMRRYRTDTGKASSEGLVTKVGQ